MAIATIQDRFADLVGGGMVDPAPIYADARASAPVFWSDATGGWVVTRRDDVHRVLTDEEHFGPLASGAGSSASHGRTILHMSGDEHRRKLAPIAHRIRRTATLTTDITELITELTQDLATALPADGHVELKAAFTTPMPLIVTARIMGLPDAPNFRDWYDAIVAAGASNLRGDEAVAARGAAARSNLAAWLTPIIADRRDHPRDDLLTDLCTLEWEGRRLETEEVVSFCSFILAAGVETTDRALSNLLKYLITHRADWEAIAHEPSLLPAACAEILRWAPPVHAISRGVTAPTEIHGVAIEAGARVLAVLAAANRDERHFVDAERFDRSRFVDNPRREFTPRSSILPFGAGTHHCTGSLLALQEMIIAMETLLAHVEWIEFEHGVPEDVGYVLRSPTELPVRLHYRRT